MDSEILLFLSAITNFINSTLIRIDSHFYYYNTHMHTDIHTYEYIHTYTHTRVYIYIYIYILTNSIAYGTRRFNAAFTRALQ